MSLYLIPGDQLAGIGSLFPPGELRCCRACEVFNLGIPKAEESRDL